MTKLIPGGKSGLLSVQESKTADVTHENLLDADTGCLSGGAVPYRKQGAQNMRQYKGMVGRMEEKL